MKIFELPYVHLTNPEKMEGVIYEDEIQSLDLVQLKELANLLAGYTSSYSRVFLEVCLRETGVENEVYIRSCQQRIENLVEQCPNGYDVFYLPEDKIDKVNLIENDSQEMAYH